MIWELVGLIFIVLVVMVVVVKILTGPIRGKIVKTVAGIKPINQTSAGLALKGYDPVAYFQQGQAVAGSKDLVFQWQGTAWRFASPENRDRFAQNPEQYAPQYGGYCAWAVSRGYTADVDPHVWKIMDGKLFLNNNASVGKDWENDAAANIAKADQIWPNLASK